MNQSHHEKDVSAKAERNSARHNMENNHAEASLENTLAATAALQRPVQVQLLHCIGPKTAHDHAKNQKAFECTFSRVRILSELSRHMHLGAFA
jgi:hypothetical protein